MKKQTALTLLGGSPRAAARQLGISRQAIYAWPEQLPRSMADKVLAARVRMQADRMKSEGLDIDPLELDTVEI